MPALPSSPVLDPGVSGKLTPSLALTLPCRGAEPQAFLLERGMSRCGDGINNAEASNGDFVIIRRAES